MKKLPFSRYTTGIAEEWTGETCGDKDVEEREKEEEKKRVPTEDESTIKRNPWLGRVCGEKFGRPGESGRLGQFFNFQSLGDNERVSRSCSCRRRRSLAPYSLTTHIVDLSEVAKSIQE